ncbi:MAG: phospholipid carrier-dependent glycosyltransferase [Actinobacteria bacterium]|nr:phospholipid carrier-dependent glycosyltransferase [Actinomycetota bacterium]
MAVSTPVVADEEPTLAQPAGGASRWLPWLGPLAVTLIGGLLRFIQLGRPDKIVFDETYYIKDALALLRFGHEVNAVDGADQLLLDSNGDPWSVPLFLDSASFIVHPPIGKWTIALGELTFGATPFGWRFMVALLGTLSVLLLARAVWLLTDNWVWGSVAGLLLAIDGMAIVMSRTAVLDGVLAFFVLAAFLALVKDRLWVRARDLPVSAWSWWRPYRYVAGIMLGLACAVKWSGLWYLVAFGLMTVLWEVGRRYRAGVSGLVTLIKDGLPAIVAIVAVAVVVYLLSWAGWFAGDGGYNRDWAGDGPLAALQSLLHYHSEMWNFHTTLTSEHSYQSPAWGWLIQARPTSFFFESFGSDACHSGTCAQEVIALGNPIIWWAAILALLHQTWRWFAVRDWRSGAVVLGVVAGWAPWLLYPDRTIFAFYSVVLVPFSIAALTLSLMQISNGRMPASRPDSGRVLRLVIVALFLLGCVVLSWYFYPIWSGTVIDNADWSSRMWFSSWV